MMKQREGSTEPELAFEWPLSKVTACLDSAQRDLIVTLIQQRYEERFLYQSLYLAVRNRPRSRLWLCDYGAVFSPHRELAVVPIRLANDI